MWIIKAVGREMEKWWQQQAVIKRIESGVDHFVSSSELQQSAHMTQCEIEFEVCFGCCGCAIASSSSSRREEHPSQCINRCHLRV